MQGAPENLIESLPTASGLPLRLADFDTFVDAVDYASKGANGLNYYSARGEILDQLSFIDMRARSEKLGFYRGQERRQIGHPSQLHL